MAEMTGSDALAIMNSRNNGGMFGDGGWGGAFWIFALLLLNNGGLGGYNRGGVTEGELAVSQNQQTQQIQLNQLSEQVMNSQLQAANNRFDMAQLITQQTSQIQNQANAYEINAIQGFNNLGLQIMNHTNQIGSQLTNGFNQIGQTLQAMSAQQEQCCCKILTQMLQDRLSDAQALNVAYRGQIDNAAQTQTILNTMGHWTANTTSTSAS